MTPPRHIGQDDANREAEEPTRDRMIHPSPCEALQRFREQYVSLRALAGAIVLAAAAFGGYLWTRYDTLAEAGNSRAVAISAISAKLDGIDRSLERIEGSLQALHKP